MGCNSSKKAGKEDVEATNFARIKEYFLFFIRLPISFFWIRPDPCVIKQEAENAELSVLQDNYQNQQEPLKSLDQVAKWDSDHVKLPHSPECFIMGVMRWKIIQRGLTKPIRNTRDLEAVIESYNLNVSFGALRSLLRTQNYARQFFDETLPGIIELALELPKIINFPIPLLKKGKNDKISLTQQQVACLMANGFLCTFPKQNVEMGNYQSSKILSINFTRLFGIDDSMIVEKLKCLVNYLRRVSNRGCPGDVLTFQRRVIKEMPMWDTLHDYEIDYSSIKVVNEKIEEAQNMLHVNFANKCIGGGVLGRGCVQEEIRCVINPEMIVAKLFTESLEDNEALEMIGCERFNSYRGYSSSFQFAGNYEDKTLPSIRRVVAIDALEYRNNREQFLVKNILRDLNKAHVGFYTEEEQPVPVASGLWGCGAFKGHPVRSVLIQAMACAVNRRGLCLHIVNDRRMQEELTNTLGFLRENHVSVGGIYQLLENYYNEVDESNSLHFSSFIKQKLQNHGNAAHTEVCTSSEHENSRYSDKSPPFIVEKLSKVTVSPSKNGESPDDALKIETVRRTRNKRKRNKKPQPCKSKKRCWRKLGP